MSVFREGHQVWFGVFVYFFVVNEWFFFRILCIQEFSVMTIVLARFFCARRNEKGIIWWNASLCVRRVTSVFSSLFFRGTGFLVTCVLDSGVFPLR